MPKVTNVPFTRDIRVEDRIVNAAIECFQRSGIDGTSMDTIAKAARMARQTMYRYFPSRHHLAVEVLVREIRDHTRMLTPLLRQYSYPPKAMTEALVQGVVSARRHPSTQIIVSDIGAELMSKVPGSDRAMLDAMSEQWLPTLYRWKEAGYLRPQVKFDELLLWITMFLFISISRGTLLGLNVDMLRQLITNQMLPSLFDLERLKLDFPAEFQ
ncbi:MAG: putative TetR family transcriptional regulator [Hydrocarboniphaga sp.]|nr:putative TetR family transcriptional regulator [Hydrocarboniphaga sp.]